MNELTSHQFTSKPHSIAKWHSLTLKIELKLIEAIKINKQPFNLDDSVNQTYKIF